jgi:hypothetical protein
MKQDAASTSRSSAVHPELPRHESAKIAVNKLELLLCTVQGLTWEGAPPLLRGDAGVTERLDVVDHRHPVCHGLLAQLVQRLEVEMVEPPVSTPHAHA